MTPTGGCTFLCWPTTRHDITRNDRVFYGASLSPITEAIKAFCWECVGWEWQEVNHCTAPACPLYPYRPIWRGE